MSGSSEKVLSKKKKLISKTFTILEAKIKLGEKSVKWEQISFNDTDKSIMVAPITNDKKLIVIKKFMPTTNSTEIVLPGGKVERGKNIKSTVNKELSEETGFRSKKIIPLGPFKILPAYLNGTTYGFIAQELTESKTKSGDEVEKITVLKMSFKTLLNKIEKKEIRDTRTVAMLLYINTFFHSLLD